MSKSTKEQFYQFIDQIMDEVNIPPTLKHAPVSATGKISNEYENLLEYEENMELRVVLSIVCSLTKEGKLQELYWLLKNKYIENL